MKHHPIRFCVLISLAWTLAACGNAATSAPVQVEPAQISATEVPAVASAALFQIVKPDGTKFDVTLEAVKGLPLASLTVDGKAQEGPKLIDILKLAGITDFMEVTLTGSSAAATLTREQVDDNTILDFSNRGTMKLATAYIPKANWTKDITEIVVK
jgi:hypothetical protein